MRFPRLLVWSRHLMVAVVLALPAYAGAQTISAAAVSNTTVVIVGERLSGANAGKVGSLAITDVAVNSEGTIVTASLGSSLSPGTYALQLTVATAPPGSCRPPAPAPSWVCLQSGGWVPENHPLAIAQTSQSSTLSFVVTVGATGPAGPAGPAGPTGATGATGTLASAYAHVFAFADDEDPQEIPPGASIVFEGTGAISGITHSGASLTIQSSGTYELNVMVGADWTDSLVGVYVNGTRVNGTQFGSGELSAQIVGNAILTLTAGDVLTIRNDYPDASLFLTTCSCSPKVGASVVIKRIQ